MGIDGRVERFLSPLGRFVKLEIHSYSGIMESRVRSSPSPSPSSRARQRGKKELRLASLARFVGQGGTRGGEGGKEGEKRKR